MGKEAALLLVDVVNRCQDPLPDVPQATWGTCSIPADAGLLCNATCGENYEGSPSATCVVTSWVPDGTCTPKGTVFLSPVVPNSEIIQPCVLCGLCLLMLPVHGGFEASKYCTS
jgi:hypothetical protein